MGQDLVNGGLNLTDPQFQQYMDSTNPSAFETGLGNFSLAAQGIGGLMGAYSAFEQTQMMKDQFKASLADRNQNIANQAATTNLGLRNQASIAAQMYGNKAGSDAYRQYIDQNQVQVDGSAIRV